MQTRGVISPHPRLLIHPHVGNNTAPRGNCEDEGPGPGHGDRAPQKGQQRSGPGPRGRGCCLALRYSLSPDTLTASPLGDGGLVPTFLFRQVCEVRTLMPVAHSQGFYLIPIVRAQG